MRPALARAARLFGFIALLLLAGPASAQRQWLDDGVTPTRYVIAIAPNAEAGTFTGTVRIEARTGREMPALTLNALDMTISRARIDGRAAAAAFDESAQTVTLAPARALRPGRHVIEITYAGRIYDEAYGLFRVSYEDERGPQRMLATQFEPADARRIAPMWDQPNRRAVFVLSVDAPAGQQAVSNMPLATTERLRGGATRFTFEPTPPMPSYLLFTAVGDIERIHMDVDGVDVGVITRRGQAERGRAALNFAAESLRWYTDYFGIRYPLPKLDMIAVPGAGGFGAMENWGAILYFDQYLLLDADRSSEADRQNVFGIVAHEIAHQWFGNLVTMAWWDDLWLNEGFASWMASKAAEALHPDWAPWRAEAVDGRATALALDARAGTHAVVQTVNTIDEANLAFDTITYNKGQAVIRMLEAYVGEDAFRDGVRAYLNERLYGNAATEDLWRAVQAASGQPVLDVARNFTSQVGYPIITAQARCANDGGALAIDMTQSRFAMDEASRTGERWTIPIVARRVGGEPARVLSPAAPSFSMSLPGACGPYVVNAGQSGFFRVLYDRANLSALAANMRALSADDQLGLLLDYWAFGRSGHAPLTDYLDLVATLPADADSYVAMDTTGSMRALVALARGRPSEAAVTAYARRTLAPFLARVGWAPRAGEPANETLLRSALITALGEMGDPAVIAEARRRVDAAPSDPGALPGAIRGAALTVVAMNADEPRYARLRAEAEAARDFVEQRRLYNILAQARDPRLARHTLDLTLGEAVPRQIRTQVIQNVAATHPRLAWDFLVAHRAAIENLLDPLQRLEYAPEIASVSAEPAMAAELEAYARDFPAGARPTVAAAIAQINARADMINRRLPAAEAWIARR